MMSKKLFAALIACHLTLISPQIFGEELVLGQPQYEAVQDVAADLLTEIYTRAGLQAHIEPLPAARITQMSLNNQLDGETARITPYFEKNPSLLKVEPAFYYLTTVAFAQTNRGIKLASIKDLKKYRVGIVRGVAHAAVATEDVPNLEVTDSPEQLFNMLDLDRIDIVIDAGINGHDTIKQLKLTNISAISEIARYDLYTALIPSRAHLAPQISSVIQKMKASGELKKLTHLAEKKRLNAQQIPDENSN